LLISFVRRVRDKARRKASTRERKRRKAVAAAKIAVCCAS
jgi:hypothetical protein